ncbi:unnamed protein product [Moneuplotes crassus]|uniref:Uncharacterized protein n=1 Tax=Euplotes crassus TaxID=5936 RepID=A0AAD1XCK3_EUPCR|nr:unnamed protein product [Moneuplotes crassus]
MSCKDNIKVAVRVRPLNSKENELQECIQVLNDKEIRLEQKLGTTKKPQSSKMSSNTFKFDYVADHTKSQKEIFNQVGKEIVDYCLAGYNGTIFAYGQTGSGKTFTIQGPTNENNTQSESKGIMPRSFEHIFYNLNRLVKENDFEYLAKCSYLEIYNEQIQDLLDPLTPVLKLRESMERGVYVEAAIEEIVTSAAQMSQIIKKGTLNRHISSTKMNENSSRSHAVMTLRIEIKKLQEGLSDVTKSSFHIVDLAGSERASKTGAEGMVLEEAKNINQSLSTLCRVINSLTQNHLGRKKFVEYRSSKLTNLLRNSLGGNSKTLMIANVSPASCSFLETNFTLKFAKSAKMIKNKAVINDDSSANVTQMKSLIAKLNIRIHDLELERASSNCDLGEEEGKYKNPGAKDRVSESMLEKSKIKNHMEAQPRTQFQIFSPSMVSKLGSEEVTGDAKLVEKVKKIQYLVKLCLEQSVQKDRLFQQEIDKKNANILKLEAILEEYNELSKKEQMLISSRGKTIAKLENSSEVDLEDYRNNQIDLLRKENELLENKVSNNPELEGSKTKYSKLENQIQEINGDCKLERLELEGVLLSVSNLNRMTLEYLEEICRSQEEVQINTSGSKRVSNVSLSPIEDENQLEGGLKSANDEIDGLKSNIKECTAIISSKDLEINYKTSQIQDLEKFNQALKEQLADYERSCFGKENAQNKSGKINLDLLESQGRERILKQEIENLKLKNSYLKGLLKSKEQEVDGFNKALTVSNNSFDKLKENYDKEVKTIQNECHNMAIQKYEVEHENSELKQLIQDLEEEIQKLSEQNEILEKDISIESSIKNELNIAYQTQQEKYDFESSELEKLQEKLEKQAEDIRYKQSEIDRINGQLQSFQQSLIEKVNFQTEYFRCQDRLNTLSENLDQGAEELEALNSQYKDAKMTILTLKEKINDVMDQNTSLEGANSRLREDIAYLTDQILEKDNNLEEAKKAIEEINNTANKMCKDMFQKFNTMMNSQSSPRSLNHVENQKEEEIVTSTKEIPNLQQRDRGADITLTSKLMDQICILEKRQMQILKENEKLKENFELAKVTPKTGRKNFAKRGHNPLMEERLAKWVNYEQKRGNKLSREAVRIKAKEIWGDIKEPSEKSRTFEGSRNWMDRFQSVFGFHFS